MATKHQLYHRLYNSRRSDDLGGRKYISNSELREILVRDNVITELRDRRRRWLLRWARCRGGSTKLADRILQHGRRLFAILVNLGLYWEIKNLLDAGLTDEDLPLSKRGNHLTSSVDPAKTFEWPVEWGSRKLNDLAETQWLHLAPTFGTGGVHRDLAPECPLPFVTVMKAQQGDDKVVYKALIDPSHQEGFEIEAPSLEVALKEFECKEDFEIERNNLNQIRKSCSNIQITQSFETFSQGIKTYIMFPWAEGGDLDSFWKEKRSEVRSPQLASWCLRQMLGLAEALEFLHNQIGEQVNLRHGDLKPANILHFRTGGPYGVLKIADFGISRVHNVGTLQRHGVATTTRATTPSYEAPEAIFTDRPRSRKYDIWSLGCIFLEFTIWYVRGWEAVEAFGSARKPKTARNGTWAHFYQRKSSTAGGSTEDSTEVHPAVADNITSLRLVAQGAEGILFGEVLDTIESKLLRIDVEDRFDAKTLCKVLKAIAERAEGGLD